MRVNDDLHRCLTLAVENTLEDMAFIQVEGAASSDWLNQMEYRLVGIRLINPPAGYLALAVCDSLLSEISANIYGLDDRELNEENKSDTLFEVLNTIAGRFLRELVPENMPYQLGLPEVPAGVETYWYEALRTSETSSGLVAQTYGVDGRYFSILLVRTGD